LNGSIELGFIYSASFLFRPRCPHPLRESGVFSLISSDPRSGLLSKDFATVSWIIDQAGTATFENSSAWTVQCSTTSPSSGIWFGNHDAVFDSAEAVGILPSEGQHFPLLDESYVRGVDLVLRYPQADGFLFGLEICHRVVICEADVVGVESICSIQTDLLDCHPTFDIISRWALGQVEPQLQSDLATGVPGSQAVSLKLAATHTMPPTITRLQMTGELVEPHTHPQSHGSLPQGEAYLLLPPSDCRAARMEQPLAPNSIRYRMLAEFLEKGVIRKSRFWTTRWSEAPDNSRLLDTYGQLMNEPLPLTP
jgi:hypothetical protein